MSTELEEICSLHQRFVQLKLPDHHTLPHSHENSYFLKKQGKNKGTQCKLQIYCVV